MYWDQPVRALGCGVNVRLQTTGRTGLPKFRQPSPIGEFRRKFQVCVLKYNGPPLRLCYDQRAEGGPTDITIGGIAVAVYRPLT
jgi:hypothetical protein